MSSLQKLFLVLLPKKWSKSMEVESRAWMLQCPCGFELSWWDAGGIRWKATGHPVRMMLCPHCRQKTWHTTYKQEAAVRPLGESAV